MIKTILNRNAKKIDRFLIKFLNNQKNVTSFTNEVWSDFWG